MKKYINLKYLVKNNNFFKDQKNNLDIFKEINFY